MKRKEPLKRRIGLSRKLPGLPHSKDIPSQYRIQRKYNPSYSAIRAAFVRDYPVCQTQVSGEGNEGEFEPLLRICEKKASTVHHTIDREQNLLNTKTFLPLCAPCHQYLDDHKAYARAIGFTKDSK